jgi:hypothetical protein
MLQQLLFAWLEEQPSSPVYLHADGNYMGYAFCGNLTGDEAAAGQSVTVEGHTVCNQRAAAWHDGCCVGFSTRVAGVGACGSCLLRELTQQTPWWSGAGKVEAWQVLAKNDAGLPLHDAKATRLQDQSWWTNSALGRQSVVSLIEKKGKKARKRRGGRRREKRGWGREKQWGKEREEGQWVGARAAAPQARAAAGAACVRSGAAAQ